MQASMTPMLTALPDRPLAADPQGGQEPEEEELPPGLGEVGQPGEQGVGEDREHERPAAAEAVGDAAEEPAAQGPADQEGRLDVRAGELDLRVLEVFGPEQLGHERGGDEHVQVHVEPVEQPAEPGRDPGLPLPGRQVAQARRLPVVLRLTHRMPSGM
jgi:hypothetical protein